MICTYQECVSDHCTARTARWRLAVIDCMQPKQSHYCYVWPHSSKGCNHRVHCSPILQLQVHDCTWTVHLHGDLHRQRQAGGLGWASSDTGRGRHLRRLLQSDIRYRNQNCSGKDTANSTTSQTSLHDSRKVWDKATQQPSARCNVGLGSLGHKRVRSSRCQ